LVAAGLRGSSGAWRAPAALSLVQLVRHRCITGLPIGVVVQAALQGLHQHHRIAPPCRVTILHHSIENA
jgi:hypothetical protein